MAETIIRLSINELKPGMYYDTNNNMCKVVVSKEGRLYAKKLAEDGKSFIYDRGLVYNLVKPVPIEDAMAFGKRTGQCCVCARTLTHKVSIALGIGPICSGYGWDQYKMKVTA